MPDAMSDQLREDMECEGLLECFHGLKQLDRECYQALVAADGELTVDEVADRVDRERSTAYRSIQRLLETGVIEKAQVNYEQGGYYHVYSSAGPGDIADDMQRMLNDWYAKMGQLIGEFERKYEERESASTEAVEQ